MLHNPHVTGLSCSEPWKPASAGKRFTISPTVQYGPNARHNQGQPGISRARTTYNLARGELQTIAISIFTNYLCSVIHASSSYPSYLLVPHWLYW